MRAASQVMLFVKVDPVFSKDGRRMIQGYAMLSDTGNICLPYMGKTEAIRTAKANGCKALFVRRDGI